MCGLVIVSSRKKLADSGEGMLQQISLGVAVDNTTSITAIDRIEAVMAGQCETWLDLAVLDGRLDR